MFFTRIFNCCKSVLSFNLGIKIWSGCKPKYRPNISTMHFTALKRQKIAEQHDRYIEAFVSLVTINIKN